MTGEDTVQVPDAEPPLELSDQSVPRIGLPRLSLVPDVGPQFPHAHRGQFRPGRRFAHVRSPVVSRINWRPTMMAIRKATPRYMWVWDVDTERGATVFLKPSHPASEPKPARNWEWVLDFSSWLDCQNEAYKCN